MTKGRRKEAEREERKMQVEKEYKCGECFNSIHPHQTVIINAVSY